MKKIKKYLHIFLRINEKILANEPLSNLLDCIVHSAVDFIDADAGTLRLVDESSSSLMLKSTYETKREPRTTILSLNKRSTAGISFSKGKPITSSNILKDPLYPWKDAESKKFASLLTVPLKTKDKKLGVLSIYTKQEKRFSLFEVEMAEIFASQASLAIMNKTYLDRFRQSAITDNLTGFYNGGYFHKRFEEEIKRAARNKRLLSILFIDVDHLKFINDSYGHLAGDEVLKEISKAIRACIREVDIPARYGGDEMAIVLPETNNTVAYSIAKRIKDKIKNIPFRKNVPLTVSIGVATYPQDTTKPQDLLNKADRAMYKAKGEEEQKKFCWGRVRITSNSYFVKGD
ncbi:sensor domain-containing diguanylate cyclase [Candidatus Aerophobetes bacterium]|nr:sensor domain-containing diguanylate cyclase [Candidatus Aerophobetes bacterium]